MYLHGAAGVPAYDAVDDRVLLAAIMGGDAFTRPTAGIGPIGKGHGGLTPDALNVTAGGTQNVAVSAGIAMVRGTETNQYGSYICRNNASVSLSIGNRSATLSRKDLVIAQVRDAAHSGANNDYVITTVQGTNAASPVDPTVPASSLVLARITIPAGSTTFTLASTWIDNEVRAQARAVGGIRPVQDHLTIPDPQAYDFVANKTTKNIYMYDGSQWVQITQNLSAPWTTFTPSFGTSVTVGNGVVFGSYTRIGKTVTGVLGLTRGTTTTQPNSPAELYVDIALSGLPPVQNPGFTNASYMGVGRLFDTSAGSTDYSTAMEINFASQRMEHFGTLGNAVWSGNQPIVWATGDRLWTLFNYETSA